MAVASKAASKTKPGAAAPKRESGKGFSYEGINRANNQKVKGEIIAKTEQEARDKLQRKGVKVVALTKMKRARNKRISAADVTLFARQLATMMKAGLPLLQAFDIVAKGHNNASMTRLLLTIRSDIEQGTSLGDSFAKHPKYFSKLFCNLVSAGEMGGVLDSLLDKLATYMEKTQAIKKKVKGALMYPAIVMVVAIALIMLMMMFVLPAFKKIYEGIGAKLPWLTEQLMAMSDFMVQYGIYIIIAMVVAGYGFVRWVQTSHRMQERVDAVLLRLPIFGPIVRKATIARWARTTATLFTAGVPLVEALESVAGACGNIVYEKATYKIRSEVQQGASLTTSMIATDLFPNMLLQMAAIGEESGSLDDMLNKAAEFYEEEVDNAVDTLSSAMEPIIMVVLGGIVGTILVAMYMPLFMLGDAIK